MLGGLLRGTATGAMEVVLDPGVRVLGDLVQRTEAEMLRTKNFGRKSLNEIKEILSSLGLGFGMKIDASGRLVGGAAPSPSYDEGQDLGE